MACEVLSGCGVRAAGIGRGRQRGLTAFELMVALGITALLATLAVPGFAGLRRAAGITTAANELIGALHMARSSAGLRGLPVTVCLTRDERTCVSSPDAIGLGWLVFRSLGQSLAPQPSTPEDVLQVFQLPPDVTVTGTRPAVTFWPVSRSGTTGTFELCDLASRAPGRAIVVSQTGRPRVAAEAPRCAL